MGIQNLRFIENPTDGLGANAISSGQKNSWLLLGGFLALVLIIIFKKRRNR